VTLPTPLVQLPELGEGIYAKLEYVHPSGSMKHRAIPAFIEACRRDGTLQAGQTVAILSAGAGAVAAAWAAARMGHPSVAILPTNASPLLVRRLQWLGAQCRKVTPDALPGLMQELSADPSVFLIAQHKEPRLVSYYRPVAEEMLAQLPDAAAVTVGIGTGASLSGIGQALRAQKHGCRVVGVEPAEAAVASGKPWAPHHIPGLAPPFPDSLLDRSVLDSIVTVSSTDAWRFALQVHRASGLPVGPSAGAALAAALRVREEGVRGPIVAVCACAIGDYLETAPEELFSGA
jgi:cysteine synthase